MKVILFLICFSVFFLTDIGSVYAQQKIDSMTDKNKKLHQKQAEQDQTYQAILYFPLLLEEKYELTGPQFQQAIDRFYETKQARQAFLSTLATDPEIGSVKSEMNEHGEEVRFLPTSLLFRLCQFDQERLNLFFENNLFLGKDAFEKPEQKQTNNRDPYLGNAFSRAEVSKGARSMEQEKDKFANDVSVNRRSPIVQSMLQNDNYAFIHPDHQWPVFADLSLYGQGAGDYELNRERYIISMLALLSAYPDMKDRLNAKYMEWVLNPKYWGMLYDYAMDTYSVYDQQLLKRQLGYNEITQ
ncbi:MAG: hypothetical protein ACK4GL_02490 [Flavobacteriales bacterium]